MLYRTLNGFLALGLIVALAACGFEPIYGTHDNQGAPVAAALNDVAIANIPDRNGQILRNHLIDRMYSAGRPVNPKTQLEIKLQTSEADLGIQLNATTSRHEVTVSADYTLKDLASGKELVKGTARSLVGFSQLDAQYGTLAARESSTNRAITEVGEQIVNRISLYFAEK